MKTKRFSRIGNQACNECVYTALKTRKINKKKELAYFNLKTTREIVAFLYNVKGIVSLQYIHSIHLENVDITLILFEFKINN